MSDEVAIEVVGVPVVSERHPDWEADVSRKVREMARVGLTKNQISIALKLTPRELDNIYPDELTQSQSSFQYEVAAAAMDQVRIGNAQMIQYLCKARLGWTENNVVEHTGAIHADVSSKPMSKEEFTARYLTQEEDDGL